MQKAKSRLQTNKQIKKRRGERNQIPDWAAVFKKYLQFLPLFVLSLLMYGALFWLVTNLYPQEIAHTLFPNSYLPFTILLFFANLLFFSYLLLNTRRGFIVSCVISLLVFLKLQQVLFELHWLLPLLGGLLFLEIIFTKISNFLRSR